MRFRSIRLSGKRGWVSYFTSTTIAVTCLAALSGWGFLWVQVAEASLTPEEKAIWSARAERMGRIHAAAIYCGRQDAHEFGLASMAYFKRRGIFKEMREVYGLALLNAAREPPTDDLGENCSQFSRVYSSAWADLESALPANGEKELEVERDGEGDQNEPIPQVKPQM